MASILKPIPSDRRRRIRSLTLSLAGALALMGSATAAESAGDAESTASLTDAARIVPAIELGVGRRVPSLDLKALSGPRFQSDSLGGAKATVIAFTSTSCPVTRKYGPTLAALEKEYAAKGVRFVYVNPVDTDTAAAATEMVQRHGLKGSYVKDTQGKAAKALGARTTAEAYVLDATGTVLYRGAVDDQYGIGYSRPEPRDRYVAGALDAVLAGGLPNVAATTAPGCSLDHAGTIATEAKPTFHNRISRILQTHCTECHRDGGVGPFPLESMADAVAHAGMIRKQVERGAMPPWFAAPIHSGSSPWANDRSLPEADKADLIAWLSGSKAEGDPKLAPRPRTYPDGWAIGKPDAVIRIPKPIAVRESGVMDYQNVHVKTDFDGDRWIQAFEVRPTAREVVHHVLVFVIPPNESEADKKRRGDVAGGNYLAAYAPGTGGIGYPPGFAKFLPKGSTLHFQLHYTPNGKATEDQSALGLVFAKEPPKHEIRVAGVMGKLDIPPNDPDYVSKGKITVPVDAKILSFMPHMHVRGKAYRYDLDLPGGKSRTLLDVPRYDFNWQLLYRLAEPLDVPTGAVLHGTARYDNSSGNPANPNPNQRVTWGEQTDEEMMIGYFEYFIPEAKPGESGATLEAAVRDGSALFRRLDRNKDGKITADESPSKQQFEAADANHDGVVTPEELRRLMGRSRSRSR